MSNEEKLINEIKNEYLKEKSKKNITINSMWKQYQKMAKELSEGIYSEDNHFIYELIQNAEDTNCNENRHSLEFILDDNGLLVLNNEKGFSAEQIKAICSFGESTKSEDKNNGYIGEKGIGFKSVFKITDKPAIFSNGYRFYFRRFDEESNTEYIIPHWINDNDLKKYPLKFQNNTHTSLYLPFNRNKKEKSIEGLKENIKDIEPILLLFLKKLNNIKIFENNQKISNTIKLTQKSEHLNSIILQHKTTNDKYYTFTKKIDVNPNVDEVKEKEGRRKEVKVREIILAFPDFSNRTEEKRLFAFLPTKVYTGLKFIIQADFILQSGRENIAIDNEWNEWQFQEIEKFILNEVIEELKAHSKIKFKYLNYFSKIENSNNDLVENLYANIISSLKEQKIVLDKNGIWQETQNIILIENNIDFDTKYLKLLFGENYEQIHKRFELNSFFIEKFNIKKINERTIIEKICDYFEHEDFNNTDENIVLNFTKFLSKNLSIDSRASTYEKNLFIRVKDCLPIFPKYKTHKKFYKNTSVYLSKVYSPTFDIEEILNIEEFDFSRDNFLSEIYLNEKLDSFIKKIIDGQKENKNRKILAFLNKYSYELQNYLKEDIKLNYKKTIEFLCKNQEDNKKEISQMKLILCNDGSFYNVDENIYFSNNLEDNLKVLDTELLGLIEEEEQYKYFLKNVFKIKEADIKNVILDKYIPKIKKISDKRSNENDEVLFEYTKKIIKNFDKFNNEEKEKIKEGMIFISSKDKHKYIKSSHLYFSQELSRLIFENNSIEKYLLEKSEFDFLDEKYNSILENIDESNIKDFFKSFNFVEYIKEKDIESFIKNIKNLDKEESIEVARLICESTDEMQIRKISEIASLIVYDNLDEKKNIKELFFRKVDDLSISYLNEEYKDIDKLRRFFLSENNIQPFVKYLENINFEEAIKVYKYLDKKSDFINGKPLIESLKIRNEFKKNRLIYNINNEKFEISEVTWKEQKSSTMLFALSSEYPTKLKNFFIEKIKIQETKEIEEIIKKLKEIKEKNNDYYNLMLDLGELIKEDDNIKIFFESYEGKLPFKYSNENMKKFIIEKERIFILDNGNKNIDENFYFNDLNINNYDEQLENKIFTVSNKYPVNHYDNLVNNLKIKRLSSLNKFYSNRQFVDIYNIKNYRLMLDFAYDLLFTKFPDAYKEIEIREADLKELNFVDTINIHQDIVSQIEINSIMVELDSVKYYFKDNKLYIVSKNELFKIIAKTIKHISDKDIKDFYRNVIEEGKTKESYYREENIKEKQNFPLEISNYIEDKNETSMNNSEYQREENDNKNIQRMSDSIDKRNHCSGDTNEFEDTKNNETTVTDDDYYLKNANSDNCNNKGNYKESNTNRKVQDKLSLLKVDQFLYREYEGHCQICGDTFSDGKKNVFIKSALNIGKNRDIRRKGNTLLLCHKHHEIFKRKNLVYHNYIDLIPSYRNIDLEYVEKKYEKYDWVDKEDKKYINDSFYRLNGESEFIRDDVFFLPIKLFKREEFIKFTKAHMLEFISVWNEH